MSQSRFASITSSLLARKGEATPWGEPQKGLLPWATDIAQSSPAQPSFSIPPVQPEPVGENLSQPFCKQPAAECPKLISPNTMKNCAVRVSSHDYERLGILAVKSGTTRQHLMQEAVKQFLAAEALFYGKNCVCLCKSEWAPPTTI